MASRKVKTTSLPHTNNVKISSTGKCATIVLNFEHFNRFLNIMKERYDTCVCEMSTSSSTYKVDYVDVMDNNTTSKPVINQRVEYSVGLLENYSRVATLTTYTTTQKRNSI